MKIFSLLFLVISNCSALQSEGRDNPIDSILDSQRILIVYLSRTRNTKAIAEMIQENIGGTLVALELRNPYPEDYDAIVKQVAEENGTGFLPPLKTQVDIAKYDMVFLGFPTWGMQLPPPMKSFLHQYDLSGKTVIPFNTNAGYGTGSSFKTVKELCRNSIVLEGFSTKGGIERDGIYLAITGERRIKIEQDVRTWLAELNISVQGRKVNF